ncbi:MAG: succinate dehydrogenase, hydrophobic membrane anchor protein [Pseudomonadota bacterium]
MAYATDRKRVIGLGAAHTGTDHHWKMIVTSVGLLVLVPLFIFTFGNVLGEPYDAVLAYYARPVPAAIAALTFAVGFFHFRKGVQTLIEDYVHGLARKVLIIAMICMSYGAAALGILSVLRLAL